MRFFLGGIMQMPFSIFSHPELVEGRTFWLAATTHNHKRIVHASTPLCYAACDLMGD
jgi:hypothetical protein